MNDTPKKRPDWKVLTKRGDDLGSQIGVGFNHSSGGGITFLMDALPIPQNGQVQVVAFSIKTDELAPSGE